MQKTTITRRNFLQTGSAAAAVGLFGCQSMPKERPNILWLVSEDNGPFLGCYGDALANTPHLDQLASKGILYEHAYANAPVCAPARSTIITGMYANSMGTHHMRSKNPLPDGVRFFTNYLREAGYYCTNNSKEDYNVAKKPDSCWDESSKQATYKNRKPGQPFFAIFNFFTTHESSLHTREPLVHDPAKMKLPAYHPDTPEIRNDLAQYYDRITKMDQQIGEKLSELEAAGLADNTIIFYYADHGGVPTRSKRFLYESGTHVPMIAYVPPKFKHLMDSSPGSTEDRLVSFVDLAPTVLSLAGIRAPGYMQGNAFLGHFRKKPSDYVFFFRGRMDERYDMMRAVKDKQFRYIRNYMPHRIYGQHLNYLWRMATTKSWEAEYKAGRCSDVQSYFWQTKPPEELYDSINDPDNVHNLAGDPAYQSVRDRLSQALDRWMVEIRDTGFLPEGEMLHRSNGKSPHDMARDPAQYNLKSLMQAAFMASQGKRENLPMLIKYLKSPNSGIRYWGAVGCLGLGEKARPAIESIEKLLADSAPDVQLVAFEILATFDDPAKTYPVLKKLLQHPSEWVRLHAANVVDYLGEKARPLLPEMRELLKGESKYVMRVMEKAIADLGG